jgi:hypothetical protein
MVRTREENGMKKLLRWAMERKEPGTRSRSRPRRRWRDCVRDDGRVVDLDKVNDRVERSKVSRRPDLPSGDKRDDDDDDEIA